MLGDTDSQRLRRHKMACSQCPREGKRLKDCHSEGRPFCGSDSAGEGLTRVCGTSARVDPQDTTPSKPSDAGRIRVGFLRVYSFASQLRNEVAIFD